MLIKQISGMLSVFVATVFILTASQYTQAEEEVSIKLPAHVQQSLEKWQQLPFLTVKWRDVREFIGPPSEKKKFTSPQSDHYLKERVYSFYDQNGEKIALTREYNSKTRTVIFDGSVWYSYEYEESTKENPKELISTPILLKKPIRLQVEKYGDGRYYALDYLQAAGIYYPMTARELENHGRLESSLTRLLNSKENSAKIESVTQGTLKDKKGYNVSITSFSPRQLQYRKMNLKEHEKLMRSGRNSEERIQSQLDNIRKIKKQPPVRSEYFLAAEYGYAPTSWKQYDVEGRIDKDYQCHDFVKISAGLWLPKKIISKQKYRLIKDKNGKSINKPMIKRTFLLTDYSVAPIPDSTFAIDENSLKPGTDIFDATGPGVSSFDDAIRYKIPASKEDLDKVIAIAKEKQISQNRPNFLRLGVIALGFILILIAITRIMLKRRDVSR
jgi:hypothetical protein